MGNCPTTFIPPEGMREPSPRNLVATGFHLIWRGVRLGAVRAVRDVRHRLEVARAIRELRELDDRQLADIGIRRDDIDSILRGK